MTEEETAMAGTLEQSRTLQLQGVPESISREVVLQLIRSLGLEPRGLRSLRFGRECIEAEVLAERPGSGRRFLAEDGISVAVHKVSIPILDGVETGSRYCERLDCTLIHTTASPCSLQP